MKKFIFSLVILLLFQIVSFAETIINITNGEWEPYLSEYSYKYGFASHIVSEAFEFEGIKVEWGFFPWKRSYVLAKSGKWDASAVWWPSNKAKVDFLVSVPVVYTSFVFYHLKSHTFQWESIKNLKGLRIGFTRGYHYGKEFMTAVENGEIDVEVMTTDEQNFKRLLLGQIQIFPNDPIVGYSQIRNSFSPDKVKLFTHHPKEFEKSTLNLIISKKCKNGILFLERFNSGMKKLKKSGRLDQMYKDLNIGKYDKQKTKWKK
ncbi:MAG: amino acid ABC transporter substrate-binding protein [Desulfobacteraceae bacterium]|nr:amino acid ABC transporter substrate-binding protein [Desulfobacteraceae bacterium]